MKYRVEVYEGCAGTVSGMFDSLKDADEYRDSVLAADTRIVTVDENGAAVAYSPKR
jgi:hypothetical protein